MQEIDKQRLLVAKALLSAFESGVKGGAIEAPGLDGDVVNALVMEIAPTVGIRLSTGGVSYTSQTKGALKVLITRLESRRSDGSGTEAASGSRERTKDQKFGILDSPGLRDADLAAQCGALGRVLVYLDIDNFKAQNTRFTERVVDRMMLPKVQKVVSESVVSIGYAYAEGGDEMLLFLPNATTAMGVSLAHAVRGRIADLILHVNDEVVQLTASFGVAAGTEDGSELVDRANQAKQFAKASGKNRVALWHPGSPFVCGKPRYSPEPDLEPTSVETPREG